MIKNICFVVGFFFLATNDCAGQILLRAGTPEHATAMDKLNFVVDQTASQFFKKSARENNPFLLASVDQVLSSKNSLELLGIEEYQKEELLKIKSELEKQIGEVDSQVSSIIDVKARGIKKETLIVEAKKAAQTKVVKILLEFQATDILEWSPSRIGITKIITETPIGTSLGITDRQKKEIRRKSGQVADEIRDDLKRLKRKAYDSIVGSLSKEQLESLKRIYGKNLEKLFELPLETVLKQLSYPSKS